MSDAVADAPAHGAVAIGLHWVLALLILCALGVGVFMHGLPFSPLRVRLFNWHKWTGVTVLVLSGLRLLWRLTHRPPALPARVRVTMPTWQRRAHGATHALLYLLFFAVPLSGWAYSSALGFPVVWFGMWRLPDWVPVDAPFAEAMLKPLHQTFAFTLAGFVALHIAAAFKHQFVDRDGLMRRMWPGRRSA